MLAPVDVTDIRIETDRLILRPWRESDLADFYEYASVEGVGEMAGWNHHQSIDESRKILSSFIRHRKTLALELKENGKVIGSLGLEEPEPDPVAGEKYGREIGYVLSKDYWGRGLMPEAVKAVIDYCFSELNFDWLTCGYFVWNSQSRRVVEKCGFNYIQDIVHQTRFGTEEPTKLCILYNPRKMTALFDTAGICLETERLILRPWAESDLADFHVFISDSAVAPGMGWEIPESLDESAKRLSEYYLKEHESLALVLKENQSVIGELSVQSRPWEKYPIDRALKGREFGFGIRSAYWGRGLMPEAVRAVAAYCFDALDYDFITCGHLPGNEKSKRVIEKCGFSHLFDASHTIPRTGETHDISTYIYYNPHKVR